MLETCHAHAQGLAINTTPEGRAAMVAMNAARVAIAIIDTIEE
jgi:endonuclease IV